MLPEKLVLVPEQRDLEHAICGSPTMCALSQCARRTYPQLTFVKTNPNLMTISCFGFTHRYSVPNKALNIIAMNDDGSLTLVKRCKIVLIQIGPPRRVRTTEEVKRATENKRIERQKNAMIGKKEKQSRPNLRILAAKRAGKAYKKVV